MRESPHNSGVLGVGSLARWFTVLLTLALLALALLNPGAWLLLPAALLLLAAGYWLATLSTRQRFAFLAAEHSADLAARAQAEAACRETEARYRALVENSPDGILVAVENKILYVNPAAVRLAGAADSAQLLGRSPLDFVHEDSRAEAEKRWEQMLTTGLPAPIIEGKLRRSDGVLIDAEWMGVPTVYGGRPAILHSFRDMTQHRRRAQALRALVKATPGTGEEFFRALVSELARLLGVQHALLGLLLPGTPERVRTLAFWSRGALVNNCDYELAGSPCANVVGKQLCHYSCGVQNLFPADRMLADAGVLSYLGIPLFSSAGAPLGLLCVMDERPMPDPELAESLMTIFAARAAAEIEREQAIKGLQASEAKYRQLHESMRDAFAAVDLQGRLTDCNDAFRRMLGYSSEELLGRHFREFTPPKWHAMEADILKEQVLARGYSTLYEKEYCRKDGTIFPVEMRTILLKNDAGVPIGMWAIVRDITQRKQAEEALRQSREQLRQRAEELQSIMDSAPVALWVSHDPHCNCIQGNWMAASFDWLRPPANWSANISRALRWFRDGRQLPPEELPMQQAARTNQEIHNAELELQLQNGKTVSLLGSAVPLRDAQGRPRGCVGAFLDITQRKRAESLLAAEKRVLEWIAARQPLPQVLSEICRSIDQLSPGVMSSILLLQPDGSTLWPIAAPNLPAAWTQAIAPLPIGPMVGACGAAAWGKTQVVASDIASDPRWTAHPELCALALQCGLRACWSTPILGADAQLLGTFAMYYHQPGSPLPTDLDTINQVTHLASLAIEHDRAVQGLRQAHDQLEQRVRQRTAELADANKELDAFASAVSHDLRAPLRALSGFTQLLARRSRDSLDEQSRFCLDNVQAETQRMDQLIEAMLQFSRARRAELRREPVNLSELAREIEVDLRREDPHRQVEFRIAPDLLAQGDPVLLRAVLRNLLGNAWKFSARTPAPRIEFGRTAQDGQRPYFVADNGAGFDMQNAARLFTPFQRLHSATEFPGTGVGLATVQQILRRHGGTIWAQSAVGKGATFFFTLPES